MHHLLSCGILAILFYFTFQDAAHATGALCAVAQYAQNNYVRGLATVAIMSVGVGAMMGKINLGMAVTIAVGICILTAAGTITAAIAPGHGCGYVNGMY